MYGRVIMENAYCLNRRIYIQSVNCNGTKLTYTNVGIKNNIFKTDIDLCFEIILKVAK